MREAGSLAATPSNHGTHACTTSTPAYSRVQGRAPTFGRIPYRPSRLYALGLYATLGTNPAHVVRFCASSPRAPHNKNVPGAQQKIEGRESCANQT